MKHLNRRAMLATAIASGGLLAACTTSTSGGVTTLTLDTATISRDGTGVVAILAAILAEPLVQGFLAGNLTLAQSALSDASAAMVEVASATGGAITLTVDTASVQAAITSIVADATQVVGYVQVGVDLLPAATASTISQLLVAVQTLLPLISIAAALPGLTGVRVGATGMTEGQALAIAMRRRAR